MVSGKAKFEEAKDALSWLRGWATHSNVMEEFCILGEAFQSTSSSKIDLKCHSIFITHNIRNAVKPFFHKSFCAPFILMTFIFFIHALNGTSILIYSVVIFQKIDSPIDSYTASVIMGLFNVIGTVLSIIAIPLMGKRKVCFFTTIVPSISLLVASIYMLLYDQGHVGDNNSSWIPVNMLFLAILFLAGFNTVPWVLIGEVFPANLRSTGSGIVIALFYTFSWAISIEYLYMVKEIRISGSFLFFSVANFVGCIVLLISLPETEGKSLEKIQNDFSDNKNSKQSQNNENSGPADNVDSIQNKTE